MGRGASFLLTALAVAGLALVAGRLPGVDTLRVGARDSVLALASYRPAPLAEDVSDPVIVAIDATSMRAYPDWPWSRARHAELVRRLSEAGALAIAFDIDFSSPRDPADDGAFARALRDAGNGVLGAFQHFEPIPGLGEVEIVSEPLPELRAAARLGSSVVPLEADGSVRQTLPFHRVGEQRLASLALTTFNLATRRPASQPGASGAFDFRRARPPVDTIPYVEALESDPVLARVAGRAVFVGATTAILQDLWPTPISGSVPGVVLHALEYRMHALHSEGMPLLRHASLSLEALLAALAGGGALLLAQRGHARRIWLALVVAAPLPALFSLALASAGVLLDPLTPSLAATGAYVLRTESIRRRISGLLDRRERWLSALARIGRLASAQADGDPGRRALELVGSATDARSLELLLLDPSGRLASAASWTSGGRGHAAPLQVVRRAIDTGRVQVAERDRAGRALCVPLLASDRTLGALVAGYAGDQRPDPAEASTLESVGALVALAVHGEQLLGDLAQARDRAEVASRIKSEFLANMSHEIRTPLAAVIGYAQVLQQPGLDPAERDEMLRAVQGSGEHLLRLIDDVLDLSRIEADVREPGRDRVDPAQLCADVRQLLQDQAARRGLRLDCEVLSSTPAALATDEDRLRQVLINLMDNAIKFTEHGSVRLIVGTADAADRSAGSLRFEVRDTGVGIAEADRERIFDPLCQVDQSFSGRRGGTGLGLAIVQRLVEQLGGRIELQSAPGRGSSFRVDVPLDAPAGSERVEVPDPQTPPRDLSGVRVLVAEDGLDNQRILRMLLGRAGCEVVVADNGEIACELAAEQREPFDLILMDIAMPVLDGHEATRRLRASGFDRPIIALTAHALPEDRAAALAAGCDDYMTKPVDRHELIARLSDHVAKRGQA